jgi:hypothetical protein
MAPSGSAKIPSSGPPTWLTERTQDMGDTSQPLDDPFGTRLSPMSLASPLSVRTAPLPNPYCRPSAPLRRGFCCRTALGNAGWTSAIGAYSPHRAHPLSRNTKDETAASTLRDVEVFEGMSRFEHRSTQQRRSRGALKPETDDEQICMSWHCRCLVDCVRIAPASSTHDA